jgi:uncharacterized membrane protein YhaH (DUF805 family)
MIHMGGCPVEFSSLYRLTGRTGRMAFALTQIGVFTASYVFLFLMIVFSGAGDELGAGVSATDQTIAAAVILAFFLNAGWISLAAAVRRCHDRDLTGWMLLFVMPPILGQLWLVLSLVTGEGTAGLNRHGWRKPTFASDLSQRDALA